MSELSDFVLNYCREAGAIVEPPAYGVYDVLLPDEVADRLEVPAYHRLAFDDAGASEEEAADDVTRLHYGHALVERMVEEARRRPACARLYVNAVRLDKRGLAGLAGKTLSFPNARLVEAQGESEAPTLGHYLRFNFKANLITDEKREQIMSVLMHVQGGYAVRDGAEFERLATLEATPAFEHLPVMPPVWLRPGAERPAEPDPLSPPVLEGLLQRAKHAALDELATPLEALRRRADRFLELDRARLEQYYDDMQRDLERRIRNAAGDRRTSLEGKLTAVQAERQAKLLDVEAKYRLRITLELINLLVIVQPKVVLPMRIENRTTTITRPVVWDPLLHRIEPLVCEVCGRPSSRLFLCIEGHLAHEECLSPSCVDCKRVYCRLCSDEVKSCVVCDRPVCAHSLNRCHTCGRGTCREHVGLCHAAEGQPVRILPQAPPPEPEPEPKKVETPPRPEKPKKKKPKVHAAPPGPKPSQRAAARRAPPTPWPRVTGQKIEVYAESARPVVTAVVIASGRELAVRTWELAEEGIAVQCHCEKGRFCRQDQMLIRPESADRIEAQMQAEINALRQEYGVLARRVSFYHVLRDTPRPERRLLLRGRWKDGAALAIAQAGFAEGYEDGESW